MLNGKNVALQGYSGFPSYGQLDLIAAPRSPRYANDGVAGDLNPALDMPFDMALNHPVVVQRFSNTRHLLPVFILTMIIILLICWATMGFEKEQVDPSTGAVVKVVDPLKIVYALLFSLGGGSLVVLLMIGIEHFRAVQ